LADGATPTTRARLEKITADGGVGPQGLHVG
jgi:hypothetical protein